ncbi:MAG: hypothetical protein ACLQPH_01635 [Acidimicrobiales bacterium]
MLLIVAAIVLIAVAVVLLSYVFRSRPGEESLGSAAHRFHASTTTLPTPKNFALPPAGVYQASGSGMEQINKPPNSENDSSVMPVSVSYLAGGCWRWHIDYNTAAWHEYDFCPRGSRLLLVDQGNYQAWDFGVTSVTNLARFTCNPPSPIVVESPTAGRTYPLRCVGTNTAVAGQSVSAGPVTIVGVGTVKIGGVPVPAIHITRRQTITGSQQGQLDESWWFDDATGMPLQESRNYRLATNSPIGQIIYTEVGSWQLDSITPKVS